MIRLIQPSDYVYRVGAIICGFGPMFAFKTTWAILQAKREMLVGKTLVFKHQSDIRYSSEEALITHDRDSIECIPVKSAQEIKQIVLETPDVSAVIIDECQFFGTDLADVVTWFADKLCIRVYCIGLDLTFARKPWPTTQALMPVADEVHKLKAMCMQCKKRDAMFSKRVTETEETEVVLVAGKGIYTAVCRNCY